MEDLHKHDDAERHEVLKVNAAQKRFIQHLAEVKATSWGVRLCDLEGKVTELRERIPAGTGILALKEDVKKLGGYCTERMVEGETALKDAEAKGQLQLHDWGVTFSELVARISVLEGVVLKLTLEVEEEGPLLTDQEARRLVEQGTEADRPV